MDSSYATSTSLSTVRTLHQSMHMAEATAVGPASQPSSPRSSIALPSPPDSPSSDSISSFPSGSVSSSVFFSSAAASPSHHHHNNITHNARDLGLIIPSLTLPSALRRPTQYGQTIGDVRLLVLGCKGSGKSYLSRFLLEENEDVVDVGSWEEAESGTTLHASTDWLEQKDPFGLEKFEPARNIEITKLPGYDHTDDMHELARTLIEIIHTPFHAISDVFSPNHISSPVVANLVSAPTTPLYTALVFLIPASTPSPLELYLIEELGSQIPIIRIGKHRHGTDRALSSFRPPSPLALRNSLFRSPETLATLRSEAAERFVRWRTAVHVVDNMMEDMHVRQPPGDTTSPDNPKWDKTEWEKQWAQLASSDELSHDVARRLRAQKRHDRSGTINALPSGPGAGDTHDCPHIHLDPLHLPSIIAFSFSLLGPLARACVKPALLLIGGFLVGVRVGVVFR